MFQCHHNTQQDTPRFESTASEVLPKRGVSCWVLLRKKEQVVVHAGDVTHVQPFSKFDMLQENTWLLFLSFL